MGLVSNNIATDYKLLRLYTIDSSLLLPYKRKGRGTECSPPHIFPDIYAVLASSLSLFVNLSLFATSF